MRLVDVWPDTPKVWVQCCVCLRMGRSDQMLADVDGGAFEAFIHKDTLMGTTSCRARYEGDAVREAR